MHGRGLLLLCLFAVALAKHDFNKTAEALAPPECKPTNVLPNCVIPSGFCPTVWATGLRSPRSVVVAANNDVLVLESGAAVVSVLWDDNNDGISDSSERAAIAGQSGLNHGLVVHGAFLYASSSTTVFRWPYTAGRRTNLGSSSVVIRNIPSGGHVTRTLIFDNSGHLLVSIGSETNVDRTPIRSRIVRFNIASIPSDGIPWSQGHVFADGMRNEVGMTFDRHGRFWSVENGVDNLFRADLGGDIHNTNPSEEINLVTEMGKFYGYPFCWSSWNLTTYPALTQFVHQDFMSQYTDAWCRDPANVVKPAGGMAAHTAPMAIQFYYGASYPREYVEDAFVTQRGSWNAQPPVGYRVVRVQYRDGLPVWEQPFLAYVGPGQTGPGWIRPVGLGFFRCTNPPELGSGDCMLVGAQTTGQLVSISYIPKKQ